MFWLAQAAAAALYLGSSAQQAEVAVTIDSGSVGSTMVELTRGWLGAPYRAFSLDQSADERLQIDLAGFDCFLLVEQALALATTSTIAAFEQQLQGLRYGGQSTSYCNRQHYFSRWAESAIAQGSLQNLNLQLPAVKRRHRRLDFMSRHSGSYKPMQQTSNRRCIAELEQDLSIEQTFVSLDDLPTAIEHLRNGDIFALVTDIDGLDVTHVGLVERRRGEVNGLHAAPGVGVIRSIDLVRYGRGIDNVVGMSFYRPIKVQ